ncbi:MAG: ABC transporter ATP-binding protein, partial [Clostridia bacterium]|nr:ABC transporter ATP-binding protein [Clostridia bacterium]
MKKPSRTAPKGREIGSMEAIASLMKIIWKADKVYFLVYFLLSLTTAASGMINLVLPKMLIDGISQGWPAGRFIPAVALFCLAKYLILQLLALMNRQNKVHQEALDRRLPTLLAEKTMRMSYRMLEDPQVLDLKERALFPITYGAVYQLLDSGVRLLSAGITLISLSAVLFIFSPLFLLVLILLSAAAMMLSSRFMKTIQATMQEVIPINRRYGYYANTAGEAPFQKEYRIYGMDKLMLKKIKEYNRIITSWLHGVHVKQANNECLQALIAGVVRLMAYGYTALRVLGADWGAQIGLGDFSVIVMATENFFKSFREGAMGILTTGQSAAYLIPFCSFMKLDEDEKREGIAIREIGEFRSLRFEGVSFSYPKTDRLILDGISFEIKAGEKISIVGLNNAGKSTIVKLICRLFDPQEGRILYNGVDIREYDRRVYLRKLSCVFQDFRLFPFSLLDNIAPAGIRDEAGVWKVLRETGMEEAVKSLPRGLDTKLNKALWEEATDFSGGQKQKLAIARCLYRPAGLVIMDE